MKEGAQWKNGVIETVCWKAKETNILIFPKIRRFEKRKTRSRQMILKFLENWRNFGEIPCGSEVGLLRGKQGFEK